MEKKICEGIKEWNSRECASLLRSKEMEEFVGDEVGSINFWDGSNITVRSWKLPALDQTALNTKLFFSFFF